MATTASDPVTPEGTRREIDGRWRVYYGGYWIKAYDAPANTLLAKKHLIEALTRRLFNHVEHGINIPGSRLAEARRAFDEEADPQKKRVKGAMLAGALFNRAGDVFTKAVELQALGVEVGADNALVRQCGHHLEEALTLGRLVLHRSGEEGIDELWGEPFKAFAFPIEDFYRSRYVKIAMTMRDIERICDGLANALGGVPMFTGIAPLAADYAEAAKGKVQTLQTDPDIFETWSAFVAAGERLCAFAPRLSQLPSSDERLLASQGRDLLIAGRDLVVHVTRARVPMPKSTRELLERYERFHASCALEAPKAASVDAGLGARTPPAAPPQPGDAGPLEHRG
jgi:hypothetical protein